MYVIIIIVDIRSDVGHRSKRAEFQSNATKKVFITKQYVANVRTEKCLLPNHEIYLFVNHEIYSIKCLYVN